MMNYKEVKCSDRLPTKEGPYYVKVVPAALDDTMRGFGQHDIYQWFDDPDFDQDELWINTFESWLEPYDLPTEEEVADVIIKLTKEDYQLNYIAKAIANLLKGER